MSEIPVKIISINTWKGDGDYFKRMEILSKQLQALKPDVILCQECFAATDHSVNTLEYLSTEFQMKTLNTPARLKTRLINNTWIESYSGLGILSKYPCTIIKEFSFKLIPEDGERKVQIAAIHISPATNIIAVNVHLTHLSDATDLRIDQVKQLAKEIIKLNISEPCIVGGDFNAEINSKELILLQAVVLAKDCYTADNAEKPVIEDAANNFQLKKSVDHLFILPDKNGQYINFRNSAVVLNTPDIETGLYASDHSAITTTLVLRS